MLKIIPRWFIAYKFLNSFFLGLSVGAVFVLYTPIEPSVYSLGGIVLAVGIIIISRFYDDILNVLWFFRLSLLVEIILLVVMIIYLFFPFTYKTALLMYIGYQTTFMFGSYLVRAETLLLSHSDTLTKLDTFKQFGYLAGMTGSYLFYKVLQHQGIVDKQNQVYNLHFILVLVELLIIVLIYKSFKKV